MDPFTGIYVGQYTDGLWHVYQAGNFYPQLDESPLRDTKHKLKLSRQRDDRILANPSTGTYRSEFSHGNGIKKGIRV